MLHITAESYNKIWRKIVDDRDTFGDTDTTDINMDVNLQPVMIHFTVEQYDDVWKKIVDDRDKANDAGTNILNITAHEIDQVWRNTPTGREFLETAVATATRQHKPPRQTPAFKVFKTYDRRRHLGVV